MSNSIISQSRLVRLVFPHSPNTIFTITFTRRWRPPIATTASSSISVSSESKGGARFPHEADTTNPSDAGPTSTLSLTARNEVPSDHNTPRNTFPTSSALPLTLVSFRNKSYGAMITGCEHHLADSNQDMNLTRLIDYVQQLNYKIKRTVEEVVRDVQQYSDSQEIDHKEGLRIWKDGMLALTVLSTTMIKYKDVGCLKIAEAVEWTIDGMMVLAPILLTLDYNLIREPEFKTFCRDLISFVTRDTYKGLDGNQKVVERLKDVFGQSAIAKELQLDNSETNPDTEYDKLTYLNLSRIPDDQHMHHAGGAFTSTSNGYVCATPPLPGKAGFGDGEWDDEIYGSFCDSNYPFFS